MLTSQMKASLAKGLFLCVYSVQNSGMIAPLPFRRDQVADHM